MSKIEVTQYLIQHHMHNFNSKQSFYAFFGDAPKKYKVYSIPKRTSGTRIIAQPIRQLKDFQRSLILLLENDFPIHNCCLV